MVVLNVTSLGEAESNLTCAYFSNGLVQPPNSSSRGPRVLPISPGARWNLEPRGMVLKDSIDGSMGFFGGFEKVVRSGRQLWFWKKYMLWAAWPGKKLALEARFWRVLEFVWKEWRGCIIDHLDEGYEFFTSCVSLNDSLLLRHPKSDVSLPILRTLAPRCMLQTFSPIHFLWSPQWLRRFFWLPKKGGERVGWEVILQSLCFLRFGSGAIYRCEGWLFLGGRAQRYGTMGFIHFRWAPGVEDARMWHHLICGSKICCGFSWIYWSTVYSGIYCRFSRLNSSVWGFIRWTTENSGPCFQPKRQKRPQNPGNHHLGWVFNMGHWTRQKINWLARFCQQFPWFQVKEFCWELWLLVGWSSPRMLTPDYRDLLFLEQHGSQP